MCHYSDKSFFALCLFTIFLITIPFAVQAAVVVFKNGDRITGQIVKMEKQRLVRYEFMFRGDDVIVFHKQQGFKNQGHGSAFRVNADQGIRVRITQNWRVNFEYDIRYNSLPVSGLKTTDTNIIFGFSYDFKP